ncbi:polysaccharide deacetylase family protein [Rahnella sp. SAP-1]|uniref:Polysaccharide deacetylase family protein n=1 Tax=Rouxiella aceris TaxID=2703884 RepID=A0A848MHU9_9GAMM|nr:polysaccharide deacetylase family protein [Rouxiella aceris]NMP27988.1 polysaccharide deacetylase family protein [Rouxiella aceris]
MIAVLSRQTDLASARLVEAALCRSVSKSQVQRVSATGLADNIQDIDIAVFINPDDFLAMVLKNYISNGKVKVIILGSLPETLYSKLQITRSDKPIDNNWCRSLPAQAGAFAESPASINYTTEQPLLGDFCWDRALERFDFADEWNNLGFGAVRADGSQWSLSSAITVPEANCLAHIKVGGDSICSYAALYDEPDSSILWFNRAVGPIDSFEWHIVERFIASWRAETLPVLPVLLDIPWGHDAAVTMRLDCDEDISSSRDLWHMYQQEQVPFSLAIHAANLHDHQHDECMKEMLSAGVAFLSHSLTHAPNWGGSYENARHEAARSAQMISEVLQQPIRYAVSPFHQNPDYALNALCDVGFQGCIGGIIRNDPEFLIARGGELANMPTGFVGHSQQSMLHGDCLLNGSDAMTSFKKAFDLSHRCKMLFGYLDHPFSPRYQYGWISEEQRSGAHQDLIHYIREQAPKVLFMSENEAMDFIVDKTLVKISKTVNGFSIKFSGTKKTNLWPTILLGDKLYSTADVILMT